MGLEPKTEFIGLVTATGDLAVNRGALRVADNVSLKKEGALTVRATFASAVTLLRAYTGIVPFGGNFMYLGTVAGSVYNSTQGSISAVGSGLPPVRADVYTPVKEARKNLYFAGARGVFKASSPSVSILERSGATATEATLGYCYAQATTAPELLASAQQVAYRVVTVRTDANGLIIRSRPSGATTVAATFASSPRLVIYPGLIASTPSTSRTIELYRTRIFPTTASVDDEMQLVATFPANTNATIVHIDKLLDTARGQTLYTSPSRGGIEAANDRPPGCACLERFRGSLFFGNIVGPHRITFSYKAGGDRTSQLTGVGYRTATGTNTAGQTALTSVSNVTGLQPGMMVVTAATAANGPVGRITSVVGSTVNVSAPISIAQTNGPVIFFDGILVDGTTPAALGMVNKDNSGAPYNTSYGVQQAYIAGGGAMTAYEVTPALPGYDQTVVLERTDAGGAAFTLNASHGDEMNPPIPLVGVTGLSSTNDVFPHGLMWSEPDEPEHVPPRNFARVGDAGKAILALVATRDRLLIMKEDGVFMLTGDVAANFAIYPLDTTCLCILPGSVRRLQNTVYFLSNLGLVAIDENGGVQVVSRPIQNELGPIITLIRQNQKSTGLYNMPGLTANTSTSDDPNNEYWLMLGSTTPSFGGQMLIYNAFRGGFTTYSFGSPTPVALGQDGEGQPLVLTPSSLLNPSTALGAVTARISPRAFSDPALAGKLWTHIVAGFSQLTGTTSVTAVFSGSESQVAGTTVSEAMEAPLVGGLVQLPVGSLLRHPVPQAMRRAFLAVVELVVAVASGTFTLDVVGIESRENIPNKRPTHGSGAT